MTLDFIGIKQRAYFGRSRSETLISADVKKEKICVFCVHQRPDLISDKAYFFNSTTKSPDVERKSGASSGCAA
jgi:hypothetical protein